MSPAEFCREIETYLCRKNDGHLIRIVGPVFDTVCKWAEQGVPIAIARRGIDRYFDRQLSKGPRRRPLRVEFCEADVLDAFDEWRRAVGVGASAARAAARHAAADAASDAAVAGSGRAAVGPSSSAGHARGTGPAGVAPSSAPGAFDRTPHGAEGARGDDGGSDERGSRSDDGAAGARRKPALQTHIDRAMARLTQRRVEGGVSGGSRPGADAAPGGGGLAEAIDRLLGELDVLRAGARGVRDEARAALVGQLAAADRVLLDAARGALAPGVLSELRAEADRELEPFRSRMAPDALQAATEAALDQLVRDRCRLPSLRVD